MFGANKDFSLGLTSQPTPGTTTQPTSFGAGTTSGFFGQTGQQPASTSFVFGTNTAPNGNTLFGTAPQPQSTATSGFFSAAPSTSTFSQQQLPTQQSGIFGQTQPTGLFGSDMTAQAAASNGTM